MWDPERWWNPSGLHAPRPTVLAPTQPQLLANSGAEEEQETLDAVAAVSEQLPSLNDVRCRMKVEECTLKSALSLRGRQHPTESVVSYRALRRPHPLLKQYTRRCPQAQAPACGCNNGDCQQQPRITHQPETCWVMASTLQSLGKKSPGTDQTEVQPNSWRN